MIKRSYFSCLRPVYFPFVARVHDYVMCQYALSTTYDPFGFRIITVSARESGPRAAVSAPWPARESTSDGQFRSPQRAEKRTSIYIVRVREET